MFHEGTLQSGIALAIKEQKLVACFVRDDGATSKEWEEEWLTSGWLSSLLAQKAVVLRLEAGSTEAGFLAAFSDLSEIPTFVVIHNGQLQIQLKSHVTKDEFINSIRRVLGANPIPGSNTAPTSPPQAGTLDSSSSYNTAAAEDDLYGPEEPYTPTQAEPAAAPPPSANAKGKQRMASASTSKSTSSASTNKAQQEARDALRKKKKEEAEELARVKARIEADKAARRAEAEARKAEREKERNKEAQTSPPPHTTTSSSRGSRAKHVNLNVRLFDGRTIRSTFPREATLQEEVRKWIDLEFSKLSQDDANINHKQLPPYYFRHILAPQPSRELSAGDESQSLGDIDLAPSATLVLVPVKGYTEAYSGAEGGVVGAATGLVGGAFGLLASTVGFVSNTIGSAIGYGSQGASSSSSQQQHRPGGGHTVGSRTSQEPQHDTPNNPGFRVRTLADQRGREPQQFYNGNQLSTEHRPEDNDKRD
ncbi:hypothetical protein COCVIDRAFT_109731 [Bipolaris victoriae FI3]|uniref:UBX domain-containing protein 2 n=1 Tax=Bipolaris victoriae (strain FI3) TaxID=930091 RepID=W7E4L5_BIPV3|nr:hypothetical protein COCVIDRAFT_109731 [Bipolaris victoriae FI3]